MAKGILKYTFEIFPYEWGDFVNRIVKEHKNIGLIKGAKDDAGIHDIIYLKKEKVAVAKFYEDDMEIVTDIQKRNFFNYIRGGRVDIWKDINECHIERSSDLKHVILIENNASIFVPYEVVKGSQNALKCVTEYNERFDKKFAYMLMETYIQENTKRINSHTNEMMGMLLEADKKFEALCVSEAKIESEEQLKKFVNDRLKQKFGDKFDQSVADKVFNGLKKKYKDNYGAAVGALR